MTTLQISEHPVFKELKALTHYFPSSIENPGLSYCLYQVTENNDTERQCHNPTGKARQSEAKVFWADFKRMKKLPDDAKFDTKVESFLKLTHCHCHGWLAQLQFNNWKQSRVDNLNYTSQEPSLPGTPESDSLFDSPPDKDGTPFSSPLTEDETPETPGKSPASNFDSYILDTPSRIIDPGRLPIEDDNKSISDDSLKSIPILGFNTTSASCKPSDVGKSDIVVENITDLNGISSREPSKELPILSKKDVFIEETITDIEGSYENDPDIIDPKYIHPTLGQLGIKRNGTISDTSRIIRELHNPPSPAQMKLGKVYVLQHKEDDSIFKIGWTGTTVNTRLSQPDNCYGKLASVVYESKDPFHGAHKALRLSHMFLRSISLRVDKCKRCAKGHEEWFEGSREAILNTVKVMEGFVCMPAYVSREGGKDGEMRLSDDAKEKVKKMSNVTLKGLEVCGDDDKEESNSVPRQSSEPTPTTVTQTTVSEDTADIPIKPVGTEESPSQPEALATSSDASREQNQPPGNKMRNFMDFKMRIKGKFSREPTPESENITGSSKSPAVAEEYQVGLLWSLAQDNSEPGSKDDDGPRKWSAFANAWSKCAKFIEDWKKAIRPAAKTAS